MMVFFLNIMGTQVIKDMKNLKRGNIGLIISSLISFNSVVKKED